MSRIKPQTLKGFRDILPAAMLAREQITDVARGIFRDYGFAPIDTPALEYAEVLLGKGGGETEKQCYRFEDGGGRDVAMRFDLTVPLARFAAQHANDLGTPFRRYHIAPVWRAEKPQKGRYREFVQCDFDTVGVDATAADAETLMVVHDLMAALSQTYGFGEFTIRLNHRGVLNGFLRRHDLGERSTDVLRALDKLPKAGPEAVSAELTAAGVSEDAVAALLSFAECKGAPSDVLPKAAEAVAGDEDGEAAVQRLREVCDAMAACGVAESRLSLDLSIARGLDYYTGVICETFLTDMPGIGSVCSGGRYDNLADLFTSQKLPGVGASLGLDRLIAALEEMGHLEEAKTPARVLMTVMDGTRLASYMTAARRLREAGVATEVYPSDAKLNKQLKYADRKGFAFAVVAGTDEFDRGVWQLKELATGERRDVPDGELAAAFGA